MVRGRGKEGFRGASLGVSLSVWKFEICSLTIVSADVLSVPLGSIVSQALLPSRQKGPVIVFLCGSGGSEGKSINLVMIFRNAHFF